MIVWNPWRGCHKYSSGCLHCYIHKGCLKRGSDPDQVVRTKRFYAPIAKKKNGEYVIPSGQTVYLCFSSDFFLEDADAWRPECWDMIRERQDLHFIFLTKRIQRFWDCVPPDWPTNFAHVTVGCTVENQATANQRLPFFSQLPICHKNIICQPLLENIEIESYLSGVELVVAGGESDRQARVLNYDWILRLRDQCLRAKTHFQFRQCGTHFVKDGRFYTLQTKDLCSQAKKANINR